MAPRSIASLTLSFGLVSIPIKLFSATESKSSVSFNLVHGLRDTAEAIIRLSDASNGCRARRHGQGLRVRERKLDSTKHPIAVELDFIGPFPFDGGTASKRRELRLDE
jgi:hypothetical protein